MAKKSKNVEKAKEKPAPNASEAVEAVLSGTNVIAVDGIEYSVNDLSQKAKSQLANINFVDTQIQQLTNEKAVVETARVGYATALKNELLKADGTQ